VPSPVSPDPVFNLLLGGALGLLIGVAAGFVRTARGTTIGSPRRLQDLAAAPVLGDRRRP
jgi:capsular polysaccharide biosynthesis protein